MKLRQFIILFAFAVLPILSIAQSATVRGIILDDTNLPIEGVNIKAGTDGTTSNANGFYVLKIPANQDVTIVFSHISFKQVTLTINLKNGEEYEFNPVMNLEVEHPDGKLQDSLHLL